MGSEYSRTSQTSPSPRAIELRRMPFKKRASSHQLREMRVTEAQIIQIETPDSRGYYIYRLERGSHDHFVYLSPNHPKFTTFREQLKLKTVHRFVFSKRVRFHVGRERLPVWQLLDVMPLSTYHLTTIIAKIEPYRSRPHRSKGSTKISELVLAQPSVKISSASWTPRILIPTDQLSMVPLQTPVHVDLQYGGGHAYWVTQVKPTQPIPASKK